MEKKQLKLSRKGVSDYCIKNQYATMMFGTASDDYVSARCCILNALFPGFGLACQAIEKILKAFIYLETGEESKLKYSDKHKPFELKEELKKVKDHGLDKYDDLLKILHEHYQSRYYENPTSGRGASSKELVEIDNLWVYLVEILPMPDEVKYRMKFFHDLCDADARIYWHDYEWLIQNNKALIPKLANIEKRYEEVKKQLREQQS